MFFGCLLLLLLLFLLPLNILLCKLPDDLLVTIERASRHDDIFGEEAPDALPLLLEVVGDFHITHLLVASLVLLDDALIVDQITVLEVTLNERLEILAVAVVLPLAKLLSFSRHYLQKLKIK